MELIESYRCQTVVYWGNDETIPEEQQINYVGETQYLDKPASVPNPDSTGSCQSWKDKKSHQYIGNLGYEQEPRTQVLRNAEGLYWPR